MATSPFDSHLYRDLFHDVDVAKLFSDSAEVRAMMIVEGALARAQAKTGLIPELSAAAIQRAAMETQIDPGALAQATGQNAVPVPAFVEAFRAEMNAPEHAQYLHFGATSQDIMDTGLMLRMRQVLTILDERISNILSSLADLAEANAQTPMAGRTYGQTATFTSFGAVVAAWGMPLMRLHARLAPLRDEVLCVSLSGAAGTLSAMGTQGADTRAAFAEMTGLTDPGHSWHTNRDRITSLAAWMVQVSTTLAKMGEDVILLTSSDVAEITLGGAGASSTMPQKQNPVQPSVLVALGNLVPALNAALQGAAAHKQQRDGAAWMTEWLTLPQLCMATAKACSVAQTLVPKLTVHADQMRANAEGPLGLIYAEALSFALAQDMPRPQAQAEVKSLCLKAQTTKTSLRALAIQQFPFLDHEKICAPTAQLGLAPQEALEFARDVRA